MSAGRHRAFKLLKLRSLTENMLRSTPVYLQLRKVDSLRLTSAYFGTPTSAQLGLSSVPHRIFSDLHRRTLTMVRLPSATRVDHGGRGPLGKTRIFHQGEERPAPRQEDNPRTERWSAITGRRSYLLPGPNTRNWASCRCFLVTEKYLEALRNIYIDEEGEIPTVIHEQNIALARRRGKAGATHLNLESIMLSNPISNELSLDRMQRPTMNGCNHSDMYDASTCAEMFKILPACLESIRFAQQIPEWSLERRVAAQNICQKLEEGNAQGTVVEDVRKKCYSKVPKDCLPHTFNWINDFFWNPESKNALGITDHIDFKPFTDDVTEEFWKYGDR
ncbi:hypothetical protein K438DRAFT_2123666 [Mycena galopus ATCC 62051]|nr:hypothetical protein K438DRAFT_2123666 [Mycena galopus ATCC 62051]